jgi:predicted PolB exonuclease-like 3'-5' exonuclease
MNSVTVWDLETIPDLRGFAAANDLDGKSDDEIREAMGDKFPKHIYHSIACIGALIAHRNNDHWVVDALGAPHVGERTEKELIASFVDRIEELSPQLVTHSSSGECLLSEQKRTLHGDFVSKISLTSIPAGKIPCSRFKIPCFTKIIPCSVE